jgi:rhodanese-related sulfurtransferase
MKLKFLAILLVFSAALAFAADDTVLISVQELQTMMEDDEAYLVDVRDLMSYLSGHIPGAYAVPLSELPEKLEDLSAVEKTIVTYCACPAEETSLQAALYLSANGIENVKVLRGGIRDWTATGSLVRGPRRY